MRRASSARIPRCRHILRSGAAVLCLAACGDAPQEEPAEAPDYAPLPGVWSGTFPCRDCPGIETTLWLRGDGRYFIRQEYLAGETGDASQAYGLGRWRTGEADGTLVLEGAGPSRVFERAGQDALLMRTESALEHRLSRDAVPKDFTSSIRMWGTMQVRADGTYFRECLTGIEVPVSEMGDFGRFRHQYRSVRRQGEPVSVELEGSFQWSRDGSPASLTIDRLVTLRRGDACEGDSV